MTAPCVQAADPRLWLSGDAVLAGACREIPAAVLDEVQQLAMQHPELLTEQETCSLAPLAGGALALFCAAVDADLVHGPGFCRLSTPRDVEPAMLRLLFLGIGSGLGQLMTQYGRIYAVKDRGADYRNSTAPVSMTKERTGFHTDSSARDVVPDHVALLCECPAREGGDSLVSNALHIRAMLEQHEPETLRLLQRDYVRDLITPDREKTPQDLLANRFAVFANDDSPAGITFRYMRYWLERGQERAGLPIDKAVTTALDRLDAMLAAPQHVVQFKLARGDMLFVNNRTLAHDRTAFQDDPASPRLLWRMWIKAAANGC